MNFHRLVSLGENRDTCRSAKPTRKFLVTVSVCQNPEPSGSYHDVS